MANPVDLTAQVKKPSLLPVPPQIPDPNTANVQNAGGPQLPPEIAGLVNSTIQNQQPPTDTTPPEVNGVIGGLPQAAKPDTLANQPTPPPDPVKDLIGGMQSESSGVPQREKSLGEKVLPFLRLAGVIGGGMEAAGEPFQQHQGSEMFQGELNKEKEMRLAQQKLQMVEAPLAQAHADYYSQFNPTKQKVQEMKGENQLDVQDSKNAGLMSVEELKAAVALGKIARTVSGIDPTTGQMGTLAYNGAGQLVGKLQGSLASSSFYPKSSSHDVLQANAEGNINKFRLSSSSAPVIPGRGTPPADSLPPGGQASSTGKMVGVPGANPITNPQGAPQGQPPIAPVKTGPVPAAGLQGTPVLDANGNQLHKPLDVEAKKALVDIYRTQGMIADVKPDLQSVVNDMKGGGTLMDSAKIRANWQIYKSLGLDPSNVNPNSIVSYARQMLGVDIDPRLARIFPTIAMLQIIGSKPYMGGIRNFNYIQQIQQHIPDPEKDSPDNMLNKLNNLEHNLPGLETAIYAGNGINQGGRQGAGQPRSVGQKIDLSHFDNKQGK